MGTPDFAVASLRRLVEDGHEVIGVFTQPDKPKNRGMKLTFSPVKEYALTQDLPVYQPLKMRDGEALGILRELAPELIVVAAYGKILPQEILDLPQYGCINVHSSLLPKYRGAAPINWAILNGECVTGVSIMYMVAALDAGDVIRMVSTEIGEREDAAALTLRLSELGAQALSDERGVLDRAGLRVDLDLLADDEAGAHGGAALDLAFAHLHADRRADVVRGNALEKLHFAGVGIDLDLDDAGKY